MITRKLIEAEGRNLKVERTFKIQPRLANFFSVATREPPIKDTGASAGDGDNRICVAA
jgi:hypothetical protein